MSCGNKLVNLYFHCLLPKPIQIHPRANYSSQRMNQILLNNALIYNLYLAPFINTHNNGHLWWHVFLKTLTKL